MSTINMNVIDMLSKLKSKDVDPQYLLGMNLADMVQVCKAWCVTDVQISPEMAEESGDLWDCVSFDVNKFNQLVDNIESGTFQRLMMANVIYPDGTYNYDYVVNELNMAMANTVKRKH